MKSKDNQKSFLGWDDDLRGEDKLIYLIFWESSIKSLIVLFYLLDKVEGYFSLRFNVPLSQTDQTLSIREAVVFKTVFFILT